MSACGLCEVVLAKSQNKFAQKIQEPPNIDPIFRLFYLQVINKCEWRNELLCGKKKKVA